MILELYFSNIDKNQWNLLAENITGGLGNAVYSVLQKIEEFEKQNPDASSIELADFLTNIGLEEAGSGIHRIVFSIDDDHVIKVATNQDGLTANRKESNHKFQGVLKDFLPKVYMSGRGSKWVVMEKVKTGRDLGLNSFEVFDKWFTDIGKPESISWPEYKAAMNMFYRYNKKMPTLDALEKAMANYEWTDNQKRDFLESPLFYKFVRTASDTGLDFLRALADLHDGNLGWTTEGDPVVLDWG